LLQDYLSRGHEHRVRVRYDPALTAAHLSDPAFRVRTAAVKDAPKERRFLDFGIHARTAKVMATREISGTIENPQVVEFPLTLTRGNATSRDNRLVYLREKGSWDDNDEGGRKRSEAVKRNGVGPELALWVDWVEIERIPNSAKPKPPGFVALNLPLDDKAPAPTTPELRAALERFATEAFRGAKPPASYLDRLLAFYDVRRKAGDKPTAALKETLALVLSSPMFIYLAEPAPDDKKRALNDQELAVRLSYFLWSAPPDATLRELARKGELSKPDILAAQTERLLADPRSKSFLQPFTNQWLGMDRFEFFEVNRALYPRFDTGTKVAAKGEVHETIAYAMRTNTSLRDLLKSDYVVINRILAHYYGIEGVKGDEYEKIKLPQGSPRGGLLGMAAIHFMGGNGERTSPVERGAWVLRKLLHDAPPPAPAAALYYWGTPLGALAAHPPFDCALCVDVLYIALRDGLGRELSATLRWLVAGGAALIAEGYRLAPVRPRDAGRHPEAAAATINALVVAEEQVPTAPPHRMSPCPVRVWGRARMRVYTP
jgi:hypothetical protein